jgi:hypothetical protein
MEVALVFEPDTKSLPESLQDLLCQLDGIYAARIILEKDKEPKEIHILASEAKSPKALTRDIQSALMASYGISVDYRIISIAQVAPKMIEKQIRLRYGGIETKFIDGCGNISVYLSWGDDRREGKASYTSRSRYHGVALATLDAISKYISGNSNCWFELITTELTKVGGMPVALVAMCDEHGQQLLGSSYVMEDADNAVVRAVLDALNRRIARLGKPD